MTDEEIERRLSQLWEHARRQEKRVSALETWRAQREAVAGWRHWILPIVLSAVLATVSVINLLH